MGDSKRALIKSAAIPITGRLVWEDSARQTKEKFAFVFFIVLPIGFGITPVLSFGLAVACALCFVKPLDLKIALTFAKDRARVRQLLRDSGRVEEALNLCDQDVDEKIVSLKLLAKQRKDKGLTSEAIRLLEKAVDMIPQHPAMIPLSLTTSPISKKKNDPPSTSTSPTSAASNKALLAEDEKEKSRKRNEKIMELAEVINDLASVLQEQPSKDLSRIHSLFGKAVQMGRDAAGANDPRVTVWIMNLGIFKQQELGELSESERLYDEVLHIRRSILGEDDPLVAQWMVNMAYLMLSRPDSSEIGSKLQKLVQDALTIRRKVFGNDHVDVASSLNDCALMAALTAQDDSGLVKAREFGVQSADTYERVLGKEHPLTVKARADWG